MGILGKEFNNELTPEQNCAIRINFSANLLIYSTDSSKLINR